MAVVSPAAVSGRMRDEAAAPPPSFSLVAGGPTFRLLRSLRLSGPDLERVGTRAACLVLLAWLPLLLLSAYEGHAWGRSTVVPFLRDFEAQGRFLLALPLLVLAELTVHQRVTDSVRTFSIRDLVPADAQLGFQAALASATRLRDSPLAEGLLLAVALLGGHRLSAALTGAATGTWKSGLPAPDGSLSAAGLWFAYVSLPLFQFLLLRWYYRMFIWARFLWAMARLQLQLVATHPDRVGGLGFLNEAAEAFLQIAIAHGVVVAAVIAQAIFHSGASLLGFKTQVAVLVVLVLLLLVAPLLFFMPLLWRLRRAGLSEYGLFAIRYTLAFDRKWIRRTGANPDDETLLGTPDLQSLADLGNSFAVVGSINTVLVSRRLLVWLLLYTLAPVLPLVLTEIPLDQLVKQLIGMLL